MSSILYYSNFCDKSKSLLQRLAKSKIKEGIHYMCIDKRVKGENGAWYIVLEDGQQIILPPHVNRVPALLLLNQNHAVLYGDQITNHLKPLDAQQNNVATGFNGEPSPFSTSSEFMGGFGVTSDNYSFLDQNDDELSVKGNGGLRQMHNYVSLNDSMNLTMQLPTDEAEYKNDKLKDGENNIEALQRKREQEFAAYK